MADYSFLALAIGVLGSLVASLVWLWGLRRLKPRLEVSPHIVEEHHPLERGSAPSYSIKVLNQGRRAAVNIQFELALIRPRRTRGGEVESRRLLALKGAPPLALPGKRSDDTDARNAFRVRTAANIRELLLANTSGHIRFRIYARDEVSGIGQVFECRYHEPDADILVGKYAKGQTFDVVPNPTEPQEAPRRSS